MRQKRTLLAILPLCIPAILCSESVTLDTVSVTATKIETGTKEVSQSINIVDEKTIEDKNIFNISDALVGIPGVQAESSSNSPSPRLIIRGAGLKARYGVREIMVMKDGVPMTDPDSFTRFDYIDMQDVQSIEVQKGPGSINAVNATGGVIQLITKSVFDEDKNSIKVGLGDDKQRNINLKIRETFGENDFASMSFTHRSLDNDWRDNNEFDSTQLSLKYGHLFEDYSSLEGELSYTESNSQLPAKMNKEEFEEFLSSGEQHDTSYQWQNSARDSKIASFNLKYEKELSEKLLFKPRFYFSHWEHFHPVTGLINDSDDNKVFGADLEANYSHSLFEKEGSLVFGLTAKQDRTRGAKKYEYADLDTLVVNTWAGPVTTIVSTLSDRKGALAASEDTTTSLYGFYFLESLDLSESVKLDVSSRIDKLSFDISGNEISKYDYGSLSYQPGIGKYALDKSYTLLSSRLGFTYSINDTTNLYSSIAFANQAPTTSELGDNEELDKTKSINYEVGLKTRTANYSYDIAIFQNDVKDEIIQIKDANDNTIYDNAGETRKRGLELNGIYKITANLELGASYAYSNFKYKKFEELVDYSPLTFESRAGNYLPYIPKHQYSLFLAYKMPNGFKTRIQTKSYGSYYMDNANSKKYEGYDFVTDLMLGYERNGHNIQLNVVNLFDEYYAMEATANTDGEETYKAAAPRSVMLTYAYKF